MRYLAWALAFAESFRESIQFTDMTENYKLGKAKQISQFGMLGSKEFWGSARECGGSVARRSLWKEEQSFPLLEEARKLLAGTLTWHTSSPSRKDMKDLPEWAQSKETELDVKWLLWRKKKKKESQTNLSLFFKPLLGEQELWLFYFSFLQWIRTRLSLYCPLLSS